MQQLTDMLANHCDQQGYVFELTGMNIDNSMLFGSTGALPLFAYVANQNLKDAMGEDHDLGITLVNDEDALLNIRADVDFKKPFSFQSLFLLDALEEYVGEMRQKLNYDGSGEFVIPLEPLIAECSNTETKSPEISVM